MKRNRQSAIRFQFGSVVGLGLLLLSWAAYRTLVDQTPGIWLLPAALALLAGSFSLKIPGMNGRVSVGDTVIYLTALLFGPAPAAIAAAFDAIGGSCSFKSPARRLKFMLYNSSAVAISAFAAAQACFALLGRPPLYQQNPLPVASLLLPLCVLATVYFFLNTFLVAAAVAREKSLDFFATWRDGFLWTCVNYLAGAFAAGLLVQIQNPFSPTVLAAALFGCVVLYVGSSEHLRMVRHKLARQRQVRVLQETLAGAAAAASQPAVSELEPIRI